MIERITVIGVGKMGGGVAGNLARDGAFSVTVFDLKPEAMSRCVQAGAHDAASVRAAVAGAQLVITSLPYPETVLSVYREAAPALPEQAIWMDVSTVDAGTAQQLEELQAASGRGFVSCSLGNGPAEAAAGTLPLFVGGAQKLLDELDPVFSCIGQNVHNLGSVGAATSFKIASNLICMSNLAVLAEGYALCRACGIDVDAFTSALQDTGGWSNQCERRLPQMSAGDFERRFGVDLALKDLRLAVDAAARAGVPVPVGGAGLMQLVAAHADGYGDEDVAALLKVVSRP
jgi:3-hydroxyisobutyrate dehydrogenase